jgi:hypothetical protein
VVGVLDEELVEALVEGAQLGFQQLELIGRMERCVAVPGDVAVRCGQ